MKKKQPKRREEEVEVWDANNGVKLIAKDYCIDVRMNIRHPHVHEETDNEFPDTIDWRSTSLFFIRLPELAAFICSLTKSYNERVDKMNRHAEKSVPLKTAKKLRSMKANAA
jgi:hypothetical protein